MPYSDLISVASQVVQQNLRFVGAIYDYENSPSTIIRCATPEDVSVILKKSNSELGLIAHEAAALTFLQEVSEVRGVFPMLYGCDTSQNVIVLEDLSADESVLIGNILFNNDRLLAEEGLIQMQRTIARVQLVTRDSRPLYDEIRKGFPDHTPSRHRVNHIAEGLADLSDILNDLGLIPSAGFEDDRDSIMTTILESGEFLALTHGDFTPANAFYISGQIRLFDLETHGWRHALLDGGFGALRYIHSVWAREIPVDMRTRLTEAYRLELSKGIPTAADSELFQHHLVACCAGWLAGLCGFVPRVLEADHKWGRSTLRERILAGLDQYILLDQESTTFPAFWEGALLLSRHLQNRWPGVSMRPYPALTA